MYVVLYTVCKVERFVLTVLNEYYYYYYYCINKLHIIITYTYKISRNITNHSSSFATEQQPNIREISGSPSFPTCNKNYLQYSCYYVCRLWFTQGNEDSTSHALYVWDHMIEPSTMSQVAIVAHSSGGKDALHMVRPLRQSVSMAKENHVVSLLTTITGLNFNDSPTT